jgi:hypothetical protein
MDHQHQYRIGVALLLASLAAAQNNNNDSDTATPTPTNTPAQATTPAASQQTPTAAAQNTPASSNTPASAQSSSTTGPTVANQPTVAITGIPSSTTSKSSSGGSQSASAFGGLTGLPTIEGYSIPSMVVPDTANAPFMKVSTLPEGTVFIIVGAFLAFIGVAVLFWRGLVAYSVHRSVKRANEKLRQPDTMKSVKPGVGGASQFNGSSLSMDHLSTTPGGTLTKKNMNATPRSNIASNAAAARSSSLFFSPTAGPGNHSSTYLPQNRSSSFLPSGYYAAPGAASPAGGAQATQIGSGANRYSRHSRYHDVSPPDSPALPPSRGQDSRRPTHSMYQASTSSLNLNVPGNAHPGGRAPSANLEDMLGDYPLPNVR